MATTYTENFKFGKQEEKSDKFSMDVINQNMDDIDKYFGQATVKLDKTADTATAAQSEAAINRTTLGFQRKNWLKNTATSQTVNGITFTINDDKSITANGTATAFTALNICTNVPIKDGEYIYTCAPKGGSEATYRAIIRAYDSNNSAVTETLTETGKGIKITITNGSYVNAIIRISSGTTVDNLTFYPMLRCAEITDDTYEPYAESVDERLTALETDTGWVDCLPNITTESFAIDTEYSNVAKIRRVGKYVSLRATLKFVSDGNDTFVRGFLRGIIPTGYRPSEMLFAPMTYGKYTSPTSATYKMFSAQVYGGDVTVFMNDNGTLADIYGYVVRINMDWLLD